MLSPDEQERLAARREQQRYQEEAARAEVELINDIRREIRQLEARGNPGQGENINGLTLEQRIDRAWEHLESIGAVKKMPPRIGAVGTTGNDGFKFLRTGQG